MKTNYRFAFAVALALPLIIGGAQAFAFSSNDEPPGLGGSGFTDPDAQFDVMSDQMSQMYGTAPTDYSDLFSNDDAAPGAPQGTSLENASPVIARRLPTNIGGIR